MCATEAVYHKNCFTEFYNRYRKTQKPSKLDEDCNDVETIALSTKPQRLKDNIAACIGDDSKQGRRQQPNLDILEEMNCHYQLLLVSKFTTKGGSIDSRFSYKRIIHQRLGSSTSRSRKSLKH